MAGMVVLAAACGGDEASTASTATTSCASAEGSTLAIGADDPFSFTEACYTAPAGDVTFDYTLVPGAEAFHDLVIEDVDVNEFKLFVNNGTRETSGTVNLKPGTYQLYCSIGTHRQDGMEAQLTVN